jgi:hypothetical protein
MVSPNNDDDLMSQVFASVQLPEVKWTTESHETHEVIRKTVTVNENGEQHVHTEHYHYNNHNGGDHDSDDEDHHVEHSDSHGYHEKADEDLVSQVFFNRPTVETFRVENGIPDSDATSERSSSRMSHHSHHSHHSDRHISESSHENMLVREQELENGHLTKKVLESVPYKSQQQDNIIAELKKHQTGHDDSSSDDDTLKGDDDEHTHEEMWHHEPHEEEHIVHYEMPPQEPPRDYDSHRNSVAHSDHKEQVQNKYQFDYNAYDNHDNRSNRSNSVHSAASRHSIHGPPSHHSSHDSIPNYKPPPPPQQPATRDSRASSTSTLRSDRDIRIVTNHTPPAAPIQLLPDFGNGYDINENTHVDPKGIHTYREYGTRGHRRSNASELSSVDYNRESFTVGDIEYIQEKPKARERTATKQSTKSFNNVPHLAHRDHHQHHEHDNRFRADTKQSVISQHHHQQIKHIPVKRQSVTPRGYEGQFVPSIDDSPIAPVSRIADLYGGRSHGNKTLFFPSKHEEVEKVEQHHSRASSKRGSDVSSVHSLKHIPTKNERSNTQYSVSTQASHGKAAHKRRDSTDSVGTQHTAVVEKHPGKYDSIRVVKNVRSYKQFLDVWSQREIDGAAEEGPIHAEPIPRPRYSISARHVYPDVTSLKLVQEPKHRPSLRPSEKLNETLLPGKVDKATSYHNLHLIDDDKSRHSTFIGENKSRRTTAVADDKSRRSTFVGEQKSRHSTFVPTIQEEEEMADIHHHHHHHHHHFNGVESALQSRKSTLKHIESEDHKHGHEHEDHHEDDEYEVDIHQLRSVFETEDQRAKSRRASVMSTVSGVGPIPIVPASHRQPIGNGLLHSRRRR